MRALFTLTLLGALAALFLRPLFHAPAVRAGTALRMDIPELVDGAELVVEGRVLSAEAVETDAGLIETLYQVGVDRTFVGSDAYNRVVRLPGGVLADGRGMLLAGMPMLRVGEDALLFLSGPGERGVRVPIGLAQGRYRIVTRLDGSKLAVRDQADLGLVDPRTGVLTHADGQHVRDYAELIGEVEAAVAAKSAGAPK